MEINSIVFFFFFYISLELLMGQYYIINFCVQFAMDCLGCRGTLTAPYALVILEYLPVVPIT